MEHGILFNKLKLLNLPENIIQLVVSLLADRNQFTKVEDKRSFTRIITRPVVQGSVIGPTLFIIFIIDLQPTGQWNHMTKYADECSLLVPKKSDVEICFEFQNMLK